jgi:hypothetical protein
MRTRQELNEWQKEYATERRNDPRHSDIDWVLGKWNLSHVYVNPKTGYLQTTIHSRTYQIHQLVWMSYNHSFVPDGFEINHIDGDKGNCAVTNLELCTHQYNLKHARTVLGLKLGRPRLYTDTERKALMLTRVKAWKLIHPEKQKEYYLKNKDEINSRIRMNYKADPTKRREQHKQYKRRKYEAYCALKGLKPRPYSPRPQCKQQKSTS